MLALMGICQILIPVQTELIAIVAPERTSRQMKEQFDNTTKKNYIIFN